MSSTGRKQVPGDISWSSPLVVAIFTAAATGLVSIGVTWLNAKFERDLAEQRADAERILEAIKTGEPEKAARNLQFLIETGLISDPARVEKMHAYLSGRDPRTVATLPARSPEFKFEGVRYLTSDAERALTKKLVSFSELLRSIGFAIANNPVEVVIEDMDSPNAFWDPDSRKLQIDDELANDPSVYLREYVHGVLYHLNTSGLQSNSCLIVESAVADYFAASYLNDPRLGAGSAKAWGRDYLRNLDNAKPLSDIGFESVVDFEASSDLLVGGEVLGGALWEMRKNFGVGPTDKAIAKAWLQTKCTEDGMLGSFQKNLLSVIETDIGLEDARAAATYLKKRGLAG